jgi:phosphoribosyl-ATP pyrophosphohydrolase
MTAVSVLDELWQVITDRFANPKGGSYVSGLIGGKKGADRALEKVGEEATEFIIAIKNGDHQNIVSEAADLQFHLLIALKASGVEFTEVLDELGRRRR